MDQVKDEITMQSFQEFVGKTFPFPKDPPVHATPEDRKVCKGLAACTFDNSYRELARPNVRAQGAIVISLCWNAE